MLITRLAPNQLKIQPAMVFGVLRWQWPDGWRPPKCPSALQGSQYWNWVPVVGYLALQPHFTGTLGVQLLCLGTEKVQSPPQVVMSHGLTVFRFLLCANQLAQQRDKGLFDRSQPDHNSKLGV